MRKLFVWKNCFIKSHVLHLKVILLSTLIAEWAKLKHSLSTSRQLVAVTLACSLELLFRVMTLSGHGLQQSSQECLSTFRLLTWWVPGFMVWKSRLNLLEKRIVVGCRTDILMTMCALWETNEDSQRQWHHQVWPHCTRVVNGPHFEARTRPDITSPNQARVRHLFL